MNSDETFRIFNDVRHVRPMRRRTVMSGGMQGGRDAV
jgi:hypothetical protein